MKRLNRITWKRCLDMSFIRHQITRKKIHSDWFLKRWFCEPFSTSEIRKLGYIWLCKRIFNAICKHQRTFPDGLLYTSKSWNRSKYYINTWWGWIICLKWMTCMIYIHNIHLLYQLKKKIYLNVCMKNELNK